MRALSIVILFCVGVTNTLTAKEFKKTRKTSVIALLESYRMELDYSKGATRGEIYDFIKSVYPLRSFDPPLDHRFVWKCEVSEEEMNERVNLKGKMSMLQALGKLFDKPKFSFEFSDGEFLIKEKGRR